MKTNFNLQNLIRPTIKTLKPYASARDEFQGLGEGMVFLDANENPFQNGINRYPDTQQKKLKNVLSKIKKVPVKNILLGNGSDEVLDLIIRAFCEPNLDNIVTLPPTYGIYEVLANINAVDIKKINLSKNFQPQVERILSAFDTHSKLLFLCSPNNPTANSFDSRSIEELLIKFNGIVVIDEAYIDFSEKESWLNRLEEFPNLIITQTLSKAYGMAGIRLGICYASADIISILKTIKPPYNVNELTQQKAIEILGIKDLAANQVKDIIKERGILTRALKSIVFVAKTYPSDANFILIKVDDANKIYNQLIEKGIVVRNRTTQPLCENCLRLTVGTSAENTRLINTLKELI